MGAWGLQQGIVIKSGNSLCGICSPPGNHELISGELVTGIGKAHNKSGSQVSLRWLTQQNISVTAKSNKTAHLKANMDIFNFTLTSDEMRRLSAAKSPAVGGGPAGESGDCSIPNEFFIRGVSTV